MDDALFNDLQESLGQALAHANGKDVAGIKVHVPAAFDVVAIRKRTRKSQALFARSIGVSPATLRNWEQKRREPDGPARVLLALLDKNPLLVEQTLGVAA